MPRITGLDCAVMCNSINTLKHTHLLPQRRDVAINLHLHLNGGLEVQPLPVDARPPVEQLGHEHGVVQLRLPSDVPRTNHGRHPDARGTRDHQARAA